MGASHSHDHARGERDAGSVRALKAALALTSLYMVAEALGGWFSNSLALIADAGHMLTDTGALALTLGAIWFASQPATPRKTYGYYRVEILAAFINGIALAVIALSIVYEAYRRWSSPAEIDGATMTAIAVGGLAVNLACAHLLSGAGAHDLNMRAAWFHVVSDALGSVAAIAAGALVLIFGWGWADAASSVLISLIIVYNAWGIISESVHVLLEGTPSHINLAALREEILSTEGVTGVHDLHVWSISSGMVALSAHINRSKDRKEGEILTLLRKKLHDGFGIDHLTIQVEGEDFHGIDGNLCDACGEPAAAEIQGGRDGA